MAKGQNLVTGIGRYLITGIAYAGWMIGIAAPAFAQTEAAPTSPQVQSDLGEIIVTATKRGENVQKIPASVTALSGAELDGRGLTSVENISHAVPNLIFGEQAGASLITIRGVGSTIDTGVSEPTVATYVDGVFLPRATMSLLQAVDLDRVEVLRGP